MTSTSDLFSLEGKRVILTGPTSGIGHRLAHVLCDAGATLGLVARRAEVLRELRSTLPRARTLSMDLSAPGAGRAAAQWALEELGGVDVVVNNAASLVKGRKAEDETDAEIRATLELNLISPVQLVQTVVPYMREQGSGSIVNITSMVASVGIGRFPQAIYAASKGGLESITREWAAQWSRWGIRVNAIAPGMIETEISEDALKVAKIQEWVLRNTLIPRHGRPDDFDGALLLLASDAGRYITGQTISVDGGWTAH